MDVLVDKVLAALEQLSCYDDGTGGAVEAVLLLSLGNLDNHLGSRVLDVHLLEDGSTIVGDDYITHCIDEHLVHSLWSKGTANRVRNCFGCSDIIALSGLTAGSSSPFLEDEYWLLTVVHRKSHSGIRRPERGS